MPWQRDAARSIRLLMHRQHPRVQGALLVCDKPPGLPSIRTPTMHARDTLQGHLERMLGGAPVLFPHRLDKETSGLIVVATTKPMAALLSASIAAGVWRKQYTVAVHVPPRRPDIAGLLGDASDASCLWKQDGVTLARSGVLRVHMTRNAPSLRREVEPRSRSLVRDAARDIVPQRTAVLKHHAVRPQLRPVLRKSLDFAVVLDNKDPGSMAKEAVTEFTLLQHDPVRCIARYSVRLRTGRTHQIRVTMAAFGCPVIGDPKYGRHSVYQSPSTALGFSEGPVCFDPASRMPVLPKQPLCLHATRVSLPFSVPMDTGTHDVDIGISVPQYFPI